MLTTMQAKRYHWPSKNHHPPTPAPMSGDCQSKVNEGGPHIHTESTLQTQLHPPWEGIAGKSRRDGRLAIRLVGHLPRDGPLNRSQNSEVPCSSNGADVGIKDSSQSKARDNHQAQIVPNQGANERGKDKI